MEIGLTGRIMARGEGHMFQIGKVQIRDAGWP